MAKILQKIVFLSLLFWVHASFGCSMYKITLNGKTIVGCNEDAWRTTPHIWFENSKTGSPFGAAFTGSRFDGSNGYAPQSGMNEAGLAFSRLASRTPSNAVSANPNLNKISNPTAFLKEILHKCSSVEEVMRFISQFDHSYFREDVFIYVDKFGKYLIVEPYTMHIGNDATYVLSNFCPSVTQERDALKLDRYRKGIEFLKQGSDNSPEFCRALSDSMSVCRDKIGDGTLLTSQWDLDSGNLTLYFYHDFSHAVHFNLKKELAKGDRILAIQTLFPENPEFKDLASYKTPQNNVILLAFLLFSGALFFFSVFYYPIAYFQNRKRDRHAYILLLLIPLQLLLLFYCVVLCRNSYVFYFSAPYKDPSVPLVTLSSYTPFLLLILIVPILIINKKILKEKIWNWFPRIWFSLNTLVYLILIGLFIYWRLYGVIY